MMRNISRRELLVHGGRWAAALMLFGYRSAYVVAMDRADFPEANIAAGSELVDASVVFLAKAIRAKKVSSLEVVRAYLERIEEINPWLNAVVRVTADSALESAQYADAMLAKGIDLGPLHGVPMTIKDSLNTAGVVTTWGVDARSEFVPSEDASVVSRLKGAGAILLGKTNTPELTLSFQTNSPVFGPTNNPYALDRTPGGSSGGSAAIVAASGSPFDIGSDTGGSVRAPAHFCGVTGIRPTSGRVPRTGNAIGPGGLLDLLTTIGPIARYVEDLELILPLISGPDGRDPSVVPMPLPSSEGVSLKGMKGTFHVDNGIRAATDQTATTVRSAAEALSEAGVRFEEERPPPIHRTLDIFLELFNWDKGAWRTFLLDRGPNAASAPNGDESRIMVPPEKIIRMIDRWDRFREDMNRFFEPYDLLLCPANALPALPHGQVAENIDAFSYTMAYSLTGWPSVVVRAGTSPEGLPIDVQIVSRPWREDIVLAAARRVESDLGGWSRPPDI